MVRPSVITKGVLLVLIAVGSALQPSLAGKPLSQVDWPSVTLAALLSGCVALKAYLDDSVHRGAQEAVKALQDPSQPPQSGT